VSQSKTKETSTLTFKDPSLFVSAESGEEMKKAGSTIVTPIPKQLPNGVDGEAIQGQADDA
jgi:hypothetical protein